MQARTITRRRLNLLRQPRQQQHLYPLTRTQRSHTPEPTVTRLTDNKASDVHSLQYDAIQLSGP